MERAPRLQPFGHEGAQPKTAGVVLHPSGLEGGILPVVAEDQETRPLRMVHHVLRQDMHIGHIGGADRTCGLPVGAADAPSVGPAGEATR